LNKENTKKIKIVLIKIYITILTKKKKNTNQYIKNAKYIIHYQAKTQ